MRAGRVNWRLVAWMAPPSIAGAAAGGYLAGTLPDTLLLLVIAAVLTRAGVDLLRLPVNHGPRPRTGATGSTSVPPW